MESDPANVIMISSRDKSSVRAETFENYLRFSLDPQGSLKWDCLFTSPAWIKTWWDTFGGVSESYLLSLWHQEEPIGLAPLMRLGNEAKFVGSPDLCDYFDFILSPGREALFFSLLVNHLRSQGFTHLHLGPVREDSSVMSELIPVASNLQCSFTVEREDVSLELQLPATWDEFLLSLRGKERHEIRRKLRRLKEIPGIQFRLIEDIQEIQSSIETFLMLFRMSRPDKASFMTPVRSHFFRSLAQSLAKLKVLKLFFVEVDAVPAAAALCFQYQSSMYLYNSGYDPQFRSLSAGLLDKVFSIQESILRGLRTYDFLRGAEPYKDRLGGKPVPLYRCHFDLR